MKSKAFEAKWIAGVLALLALPILLSHHAASAKTVGNDDKPCDFSSVRRVVYSTTNPTMTMRELAAYCAPIYWFSPDEPLLDDQQGGDIRMPAAMPFGEQPDAPVVYYRLTNVLVPEDADGPGFVLDESDKNNSMIDLKNVVAVDIQYLAYFPDEVGLGSHKHDIETAEFKVVIMKNQDLPKDLQSDCDHQHYIVGVVRVTARAHGVQWFFNVLETDDETRFPMHLLVEEGKHGLCTDKNSDGYYTPGYDVNQRVNDAWGVRDIIRGGKLFTSGYESWMTKVRRREHRVLPPLPEDSPLREKFASNGHYAPDNAVYELHTFPASDRATEDEHLRHLIAGKEKGEWPVVDKHTDLKKLGSWFDEGLALKSFAISMRTDGEFGWAFVFPFFIVRNLENPVAGGFFVHRIYLKDEGLRDFGWMLMHMPSASRWFDPYFAGGVEFDVRPVPGEQNKTKTHRDFVMETGVKFRVNITKSPLKFLSFFTDFWGFRAGIKNKGFFDIKELSYVLEFGAGVW